MVLTTNRLLGRDEKGNLVAEEVFVEELNDSVMMVPVSRGELIRISSELKSGNINAMEIDLMYLRKYLHSPALTEEELMQLPNKTLKALVEALLVMSGVIIKEKQESSDAVKAAEEELKKK